jgi:HSP20 family molecular chaperone IbpA
LVRAAAQAAIAGKKLPHRRQKPESIAPLGVDIAEDKVEASFKNGVLKVTLPKSVAAQAKMKRIEINAPTKH